jgi:AraC family transcriptional regulator
MHGQGDYMDTSAQPRRLPAADDPHFTSRENLDDLQALTSSSFMQGQLSVARYRRDRPGLGLTTPNPIAPMVMAVVILRPLPESVGWRNDRSIGIPEFGTGAFSCLDLRESWVMELMHPFDSFHALIPYSAFDDITSELKRPRIEQLNCLPTLERRDETMLGLTQALNPLLARPEEGTALFSDHVFSAMVAHIAVTYGGLDPGYLQIPGSRRRGMLSPAQERHVVSLLLDDIAGDPGLSELASLCGLSRAHFLRAFKQTMGLPPHRWLLLQRVRRAKELLQHSRKPINEIALECGFADQSHLTRVFSKAIGIGPGAWRRQRDK